MKKKPVENSENATYEFSKKVAVDLAVQINKRIGQKFSITRLKDTFELTEEKTQEVIKTLDAMCMVEKKRDKRYHLLLTIEEQESFLERRVTFFKKEAKTFLDAIEWFNNLKKHNHAQQTTERQDVPHSSSENPKEIKGESKGSKNKVN